MKLEWITKEVDDMSLTFHLCEDPDTKEPASYYRIVVDGKCRKCEKIYDPNTPR